MAASIWTALGASAAPGLSSARDFTHTLTGSLADDTAYSATQDSQGRLVYRFNSGDTVTASTTLPQDISGVRLIGVVSPLLMQVGDGSGQLSISAKRAAVGAWGVALGVDVEQSELTVNGATSIAAESDDAVPTSSSIGLRVYQGTATFNGQTTIRTQTPGYSQGIWSYQGVLTFNGHTTVNVAARGENTAGVYNSGGGRSNMLFHGGLTVSSLGIYPSDNVHGIYNDNVNTRLTVDGALDLTATSNGSTVFGIRNQGRLSVTGDAAITATGPRSSFGIANTYRTATMNLGGNVDIQVNNGTGYTPFGLPAAISNTYGMGSSMTFAKNVTASIHAATEAYGIINTGVLNFVDPTSLVTLDAHTHCDHCNTFAINQTGGQVTFAGGLVASATTDGDGKTFALANTAQSDSNARVDINSTGAGRVALVGDLVTIDTAGANNVVQTATTHVLLDTLDSSFKGRVLSATDSGLAGTASAQTTGDTSLTFLNGATWVPTGTGVVANDFGNGTLHIGSGGGIDLASAWGTFLPGAIPSHAFRTLEIGSAATSHTTVALGDGAIFTLLSDVRGGVADRIVLGPGVSALQVSGKASVKIAYDPALDDTRWVNASTLKTGVVIPASAPVTILDASGLPDEAARLGAIQGASSQWTSSYENALVQFNYAPQVALSADQRRVLLTGLQIFGDGQPQAPTSPTTNDVTTDQAPPHSANTAGIPSSAIRPANSVLAAGEAAAMTSDLWLIDDQTLARRADAFRNDISHVNGVWMDGSQGNSAGSASDDQAHRRPWTTRNVGLDTAWETDQGSNLSGLVYSHAESDAALNEGRAHQHDHALGLYDTWLSNQGYFLDANVRFGRAASTYRSVSSTGEVIRGGLGSHAASAAVTAGYRLGTTESGYIEPQVQLAYGTVSGATHHASNGVRFRRARFASMSSRAGVWFGKGVPLPHAAMADVYGRLSVVHRADDGVQLEASYEGGTLPLDLQPRHTTALEAALGARVAVSPRVSGFVEGARTSGDRLANGWRATAGLRVAI
ncbi:MAG: autotransporter outer membrane beta-barrel domain-containing protein [Luteibacter sp.]